MTVLDSKLQDLTLPSPIVKINLKALIGEDFDLWIKREELIHPEFGGNKWRKLKYNLKHCRDQGFKGLITFGGPFSNHIAATAAICRQEELATVGIIRGQYKDEQNPTLIKAKQNGMKLFHVSKEAYRLKEQAPEVQEIIDQFKQYLLVPEGGSNKYALPGLVELMEEINSEDDFDVVYLAAGTGMTSAGLISAKKDYQKINVINVLKNPSLDETIKSYLKETKVNWKVLHDFHRGGYAKVDNEQIDFMNRFTQEYNIMLDPIYNAKVLLAILKQIKDGELTTDQKVLFVNTGGLQGLESFYYLRAK